MSQFLKKILSAGRLVRSGKLDEATTAIQRALKAATSTADVTTIENEPTAPSARIRQRDAVDTQPPVVARSGTASRFEASSFTCAAGTRAFKLFEPPGAGGTPRPLVVMLHGCTQSPDDFAAGTRMNELAAAQGVYVLYPAQAPRSNAHKCWNWFVPADQHRGSGEPALLAGMTRHVMQTHAIDADRVFVAGLSAGGAMAAILAHEYPDLFAAAGIHSGIPPGVAHDVASAFTVMKSGPGTAAAWQTASTASMPLWSAEPRPSSPTDPSLAALPAVPLIVFHGDVDSTVTSGNGDAVIAAALASAGANRRSDSEGRGAKGERSYRRSIWRAAGAHGTSTSLAEQWLVHGAPHAWSGGAAGASYTDPTGPDASAEMLRFFSEHPRRRVTT